MLFPITLCVRSDQKNFSFLPLIFHPPLAPYIIQRKFLKIQRKISKVSILKFWAVKLINKLFKDFGVHSWGPDASFDTYIAISIQYKCRMLNASFMSKISKKAIFDTYAIRHMSNLDMAYIFYRRFRQQGKSGHPNIHVFSKLELQGSHKFKEYLWLNGMFPFLNIETSSART